MNYYNPPRSTRNHFVEPPSIFSRLVGALPSNIIVQIQRLWNRTNYSLLSDNAVKLPRTLRQKPRSWDARRFLNLPNLLAVSWILLLLWGERWVFESSISSCEWGEWERWVSSELGIIKQLLTINIATRSNPSPFDLPCGSANHRSA